MEWLKLDSTKSQIQSERRKELQVLKRNSGVPPRFEDFKLQALSDNPALFDLIERYLNQWKTGSGYGFYMWGAIGAGKTTTATIVANEIMERYLTETRILGWAASLQLVKESFDTKLAHPGKRLIPQMKSVGLLVLDDVHQEKGSEWTREQMFMIINHRYENKLPTIMTSQEPIEELGMRYGQQIASRIMETCRILEFTGEDRRQTQRPLF